MTDSIPSPETTAEPITASLRFDGDGTWYLGDNFLVFPCDHKGKILLDGTFTPAELRMLADWMEKQDV